MSQISHLGANAWLRTRKSWSIFRYVPYRRIGVFVAAFDLVLITVASVVTGAVYHHIVFGVPGDIDAFLAIGTYCGWAFILLSELIGAYEPNKLLSCRGQLRSTFLTWCSAFLFVTSILFLLKVGGNYSRGSTIGFGVVGFSLLFVARAVVALNLRRALADGSLAGPRVVIIGNVKELKLKPAFHLLSTYGTREVARFELSDRAGDAETLPGSDADIVDLCSKAAQTQKAELILLALPWADEARRTFICERLRILPLPIILLPDQSISSILAEAGDDHTLSGTAIELQRAPLSRRDRIIKRLFDLALGGFALIMLSPLLLLTGLAIKLDSPGPIIFRQRRKGFNGVEFPIYKFRTMKVLEDGANIRQALPGDGRVTVLGRLLRASSIDELPQLINVLLGEMSLVGPRPHAVAHDEKYAQSIDKYAFRHHTKPGITGWAQIHGFRGATVDPALME